MSLTLIHVRERAERYENDKCRSEKVGERKKKSIEKETRDTRETRGDEISTEIKWSRLTDREGEKSGDFCKQTRQIFCSEINYRARHVDLRNDSKFYLSRQHKTTLSPPRRREHPRQSVTFLGLVPPKNALSGDCWVLRLVIPIFTRNYGSRLGAKHSPVCDRKSLAAVQVGRLVASLIFGYSPRPCERVDRNWL